MPVTSRSGTPSTPSKRNVLAEKSANVPSLPPSPTKSPAKPASTNALPKEHVAPTMPRTVEDPDQPIQHTSVSVEYASSNKKRLLEDDSSSDMVANADWRPTKQARKDEGVLVYTDVNAGSSRVVSTSPEVPQIPTSDQTYQLRDIDDGSPTEEDETPTSSLESNWDGVKSANTTMTTVMEDLSEKIPSSNGLPYPKDNVGPVSAKAMASHDETDVLDCVPASTATSSIGDQDTTPSAAQLLRLRLRLARFKLSTNQITTPLPDLEVKVTDPKSPINLSTSETQPPRQYLTLKIQEGPWRPKKRSSQRGPGPKHSQRADRQHQHSDLGSAGADGLTRERQLQHMAQPRELPVPQQRDSSMSQDTSTLGSKHNRISSTGKVNNKSRAQNIQRTQPRTLLDIYGADFELHLWPGKMPLANSAMHEDTASTKKTTQTHTRIRTDGAYVGQPLVRREETDNAECLCKEEEEDNFALEDEDEGNSEGSLSEEEAERNEVSEKTAPTNQHRLGKANAPHTYTTQSFNASSMLNTPPKDRLCDSMNTRRRWRSESPPSSHHRLRFWGGGLHARVSDERSSGRETAGMELTSSAVKGRAAGMLLMLGRDG